MHVISRDSLLAAVQHGVKEANLPVADNVSLCAWAWGASTAATGTFEDEATGACCPLTGADIVSKGRISFAVAFDDYVHDTLGISGPATLVIA